jgi:hypothetical protein
MLKAKYKVQEKNDAWSEMRKNQVGIAEEGPLYVINHHIAQMCGQGYPGGSLDCNLAFALESCPRHDKMSKDDYISGGR